MVTKKKKAGGERGYFFGPLGLELGPSRIPGKTLDVGRGILNFQGHMISLIEDNGVKM